MGKRTGKPYQPSNGTEGMGFIENYCAHCIHERCIHTENCGDKTCDILTRSMCFDVNDPEYPKEWIYGENDRPTCTAYKHWDWGNGDDPEGLNEPPPDDPYDPNQLCLPFEIMKIELSVGIKTINT